MPQCSSNCLAPTLLWRRQRYLLTHGLEFCFDHIAEERPWNFFWPPPPPLKRLYQHGDLGKDKCFYTPLHALVRVRQRWISFWNRKLHVQAVIPASPPEGEMTWYLGSCGSFNTRAFTQSSHTDSVALVLYSCPSLSEPQPSSSCHHLCLNIYGRTVKPMLSSTRRWICAGHAFVRQIIPRTGWKIFLYSGSYNVGS